MANTENKRNWLRVLIDSLELPSTAEFCRKAGLNRGLVDKLVAGAHRPRMDTLEKIKKAYPQTNMNWLVSGSGDVLEEPLDYHEDFLLIMYRKHFKEKQESRYTRALATAVEWLIREEEEFEELERNAKAAGLENDPLFFAFQSRLLLAQKTRQHVSLVIRLSKQKPRGLLELETTEESYQNRFNELNEQIQKIINLLDDK